MPVEPLLSHGLSSIAMDVLQQGAMESALSDGKTNMGQGMVHFLQNKVDNLEGLVHVLFARQGWNNESNPQIFPITVDSESGKYREMCFNSGALAVHPGGRQVTDITDPGAFVDLTGGQALLVEYRDSGDPTKMHYLRISGLGTCGPDATFGESGMKDSHVTAADGEPDGTFWDRTTSANSPGIWLVTGFRYDPGSPGSCQTQPPKIWMYKRFFTEDDKGGLCSFTTESASVFATGCCPDNFGLSGPVMATMPEYQLAQVASLSLPGTV